MRRSEPVPIIPSRFLAWPVLCLLALGLSAGERGALGATLPLALDHRAELRFEVDEHRVSVVDHLTLPADLEYLRLGEDFTITSLAVQREGASAVALDFAASIARSDSGYQELDLVALGMSAGAELSLEYSGVFHQPTTEVVFSRENVGGEITATIGEEGIYLSGVSGWLPYHEDLLATHELTIWTPRAFETVTQGRRTRHEINDDQLITSWSAAHPSDGLNLIANRFVIDELSLVSHQSTGGVDATAADRRDSVTAYTFLLSEDARLRDLYLERTGYYLAMYEEMIGPYPYAKFATVENWFPTGYGMPSYTLLGSQVLRLPFIPYTSFGHEICHNWWGNAVFVDVSKGNWCEGLTSYCADYHYKELESMAAAREYRRNLLKDYAAYIKDPDSDFPLRDFESRHSGATRAVGYGKSMYVFHMARQLIGREAFTEALRDVYREFRYQRAGWEDFFAAFARRSQRDFVAYADQWIERSGAPVLRLSAVEFQDEEIGFRLIQGAPPYALEVPVVASTPTGPVEHLVSFDKMQQDFSLNVAGATAIAVDPDYHLFRRLAPVEIEPTISQVLATSAPVFSLPHADSTQVAAARAFATAYHGAEPMNIFTEGALPVDVDPQYAASAFLINPDPARLQERSPAELTLAGDLVFIAGKRYSLKDYDLVYAARNPIYGHVTDLVVLSRSPQRLPSLASRIGHYGKYSWLLFPVGQGRALRGNWAPGESPLQATLQP